MYLGTELGRQRRQTHRQPSEAIFAAKRAVYRHHYATRPSSLGLKMTLISDVRKPRTLGNLQAIGPP
jgi:hypothetical protein